MYDIMLTVTNEVGCWEEEIGEIGAYEVVGIYHLRHFVTL